MPRDVPVLQVLVYKCSHKQNSASAYRFWSICRRSYYSLYNWCYFKSFKARFRLGIISGYIPTAVELRHIVFMADLQSRAQSFSGSLSAVGRREKLWDNGRIMVTLGARGLSCAVSGLGQCRYCDPREKPLEKSAVSLIAPSQWETCLNRFSPAFGLDSRLAPIDLPRVLCSNRLFDWFQE